MVFGQITRLVEGRLKQTGRRLGLRVVLAAVASLAFVISLLFGLAALAVWMVRYMPLHEALLIIAGCALLVVVAILIALSLEARKYRRHAAKREAFDRQLVRVATVAAMPTRMPSRSVAGLGLVAVGALMVLLGKKRGE